jgi:hypothetical protein
MKLKPQISLAIAALAMLLTGPASARADAVSDWNAITVQTVLTAGAQRPGATGFVDIALVQGAVYDAVQAIDRRFKPFLVEIPGASGSMSAAAAKAAHDVLVNRFPSQAGSLDTTYHDYLANHGLSEGDPGVAVGTTAAAGVIAKRSCDGSFPNPAPPDFVGGSGVGVWRPTPPGNLPMLAPWLATMTPFTLTRPSQFRAPIPPAVTSQQYTDDYNEVKEKGALNNSTRTPDQTDMAQFFASNYIVLWNQAVRNIASRNVNNIGDSARLFALASLATADALITAWDTKKYYVYWRPITAIQEGNSDGNPDTVGETGWLPLITTPNYPDYTSGANNVSAATLRSLELFFGSDVMAFKVTTTNPGPTNVDTRAYNRFSDAAADVVNARIYEGIHFRFADAEARTQGTRVANWTFTNFLRPIDEPNQ